MAYARIPLIALALASALTPSAFAAQRHAHAQAREFYARAVDEGDAGPTLAVQKETHGGDCFRSLTAVEMNRGIRHWTGNC